MSLRVREKQKALMPLMKNLSNKKKKGTLRHDKLVTSVGIFMYDLNTRTVVQLKQTKSNVTHINAGATQGSKAVMARYADRTGEFGGNRSHRTTQALMPSGNGSELKFTGASRRTSPELLQISDKTLITLVRFVK